MDLRFMDDAELWQFVLDAELSHDLHALADAAAETDARALEAPPGQNRKARKRREAAEALNTRAQAKYAAALLRNGDADDLCDCVGPMNPRAAELRAAHVAWGLVDRGVGDGALCCGDL